MGKERRRSLIDLLRCVSWPEDYELRVLREVAAFVYMFK